MRFMLIAVGIAIVTIAVACADTDGGDDGQTVTPTIRDQAEAVCPDEFLESCVSAYLAQAETGVAGALCVSEDAETWFIKTAPEGAKIGDPCEEERDHFIVDFVGGD